MASFRHAPPKPLDLDLTIVSAKHLKNVNWKTGDLKPYAIFWVQPDRRLATKSDDYGSTSPVWNENFTVPLALPVGESVLTLEIFHSEPSETRKPLVGTLRFPLRDLVDSDDHGRLRTLQLTRPSGRPQGKIRVKIAVRERPLPPDYHIAPPPSYYYSSAPPLSPARDYRSYSLPPYSPPIPPPSQAPPPPYSYTSSIPPVVHSQPSPYPPPSAIPPPAQPQSSPPTYPYSSYPDSYSGYYPSYYSSVPPPLPPRPFIERSYSASSAAGSYSGAGGPSAPEDYSHYDQKQKNSKMGLGSGLAMGAVAGTLGGLTLEEGLKYEEEKIAERIAEKDLASRDDYSDYRAEY